MKQEICVLGEGAWGTAVATALAENNYTVKLWCHDSAVAESIRETRINSRYLPHVVLHNNIVATSDLQEALAKVRYVFFATPVIYARSVLENSRAFYTPEQVWIMLNKGIEQNSFLVPSSLLEDVFATQAQTVVLSGPSFARDLANKQVTGVIAASLDRALAESVQKIIENPYIKTFYSADMLGVQYAAALKNVIALGMGILDGVRVAENGKAFFLTQGLHEIALVVKAIGGSCETVYGLGGVGDLVLTATGTQSRNVIFGRRIGKGETLAAIASEQGVLPEGVNTVATVNHLAQKYSLALPACQSVYQVIFNGQAPTDILETLMSM